MRNLIRWLAFALVLNLTLAACGNRTPLRLPEPASKPAPTTPAQGQSK